MTPDQPHADRPLSIDEAIYSRRLRFGAEVRCFGCERLKRDGHHPTCRALALVQSVEERERTHYGEGHRIMADLVDQFRERAEAAEQREADVRVRLADLLHDAQFSLLLPGLTDRAAVERITAFIIGADALLGGTVPDLSDRDIARMLIEDAPVPIPGERVTDRILDLTIEMRADEFRAFKRGVLVARRALLEAASGSQKDGE